MFPRKFLNLFGPKNPEQTLEGWLKEQLLVPYSHTLVLFSSVTKRFTLDSKGEFVDDFPSTQHQTIIVTDDKDVVQADRQVDSE